MMLNPMIVDVPRSRAFGRLLLPTGALAALAALAIGCAPSQSDASSASNEGAISATGHVTKLAFGEEHTCALLGSGDVRCWGNGAYGRLGYPAGDHEPITARSVEIGGRAIDIAAGAHHTCVVLEGGAVRCWGLANFGQLGYGNIEGVGLTKTPAAAGDVPVGGRALAVAAHDERTCALLDGGAVRCWGSGAAGGLGYGNTSDVGSRAGQTPATVGDVPVGAPVKQIVMGSSSTCALTVTGSVRCWGSNEYGALGLGHTRDIGDNEPASAGGEVSIGGAAEQLVAGDHHFCALFPVGAVRCWGSGELGALGQGRAFTSIGESTLPSEAPYVPLFTDPLVRAKVIGMAAGAGHTCVALDTKTVRCWGNGLTGALGYGNTEVIGDDEPGGAGGDVALGGEASAVMAGAGRTCAVMTSGALRCWGSNSHGELGYGNTKTIGDDETPASAGDLPLR